MFRLLIEQLSRRPASTHQLKAQGSRRVSMCGSPQLTFHDRRGPRLVAVGFHLWQLLSIFGGLVRRFTSTSFDAPIVVKWVLIKFVCHRNLMFTNGRVDSAAYVGKERYYCSPCFQTVVVSMPSMLLQNRPIRLLLALTALSSLRITLLSRNTRRTTLRVYLERSQKFLGIS